MTDKVQLPENVRIRHCDKSVTHLRGRFRNFGVWNAYRNQANYEQPHRNASF